MDFNDLNGIVRKVAKPFLAALNIYLGVFSTVLTYRQFRLTASIDIYWISFVFAIMFFVYTGLVIWMLVTKRKHILLMPVLILLFISYFLLIR
ncbi:MAG: hypothetical protein E6Q38_00480 [Crocinitomicaceae bacterium]|nr:MAG: hypothetical protein E6Q38_00480 [Crocinitomicaceae bacterium]